MQSIIVTALLFGDKAFGFLPVASSLHGGRTCYTPTMTAQDLPTAPGNFMDQLVHALDNQKTYLPNEAFWMQPSGSRGQNLLFDIKGTHKCRYTCRLCLLSIALLHALGDDICRLLHFIYHIYF